VKKEDGIELVTWEELNAYSDQKAIITAEDWLEFYKLHERLDPSTIPDGIEVPDLRPREMIDAEVEEPQTKKD